MKRTHHDLSMPSYALLAVTVVSQSIFGLQTALLLGSGLFAGMIVVSLLVAGLSHLLRRTGRI